MSYIYYIDVVVIDGVKTIGHAGSMDSSFEEETTSEDNQINEAWLKTMNLILPSEMDALQNSFQ
jgi:hypothetical protein